MYCTLSSTRDPRERIAGKSGYASGADVHSPAVYQPNLLREWPVESDIVVPMELMPPQMLAGMGAAWQEKQAYKKHISELTAKV